MKNRKRLIGFCVLWILVESYLLITNYSNGFPIITELIVLIGLLLALYLIVREDERNDF